MISTPRLPDAGAPALVACDLDGTFLSPDGTVSATNAHAVLRAQEAGIPVVFATGRPVRWLDVIADLPGAHPTVIASNGAVLYDLGTRQVLDRLCLQPAVALTAIACIREHVPDPRTAPLAGNSIATDRGFLSRDMPELDAHLHYRMVDVSSIKELCRRWFPRVFYAKPEKGMAHRALADIYESIRELDYYRRTLFVAPPGPTSDEAHAVAAALPPRP